MSAEGNRVDTTAPVRPARVLPGRRWWGPPPANDNRAPAPGPRARALAIALLALAIIAAIVAG